MLLIFFIIFAFMFVYITSKFHEISIESKSFQYELFNLRQIIDSTNLTLELLRKENDLDDTSNLIAQWQRIYQEFESVKYKIDTQSAQKLNHLLVNLELKQWRILVISTYQLDTPSLTIYEKYIVSNRVELFKLATELVNNSSALRDKELLFLSANLRGYFSNAQNLLSEIVINEKQGLWYNYNQALIALESNLHALQKAAKNTTIADTVNDFNEQFQRYLLNVNSLKKYIEPDRYYSLDTQEQQVAEFNIAINKIFSELAEQYKSDSELQEQELFEFSVYVLAILLAIVAIGYWLIYKWRDSLTHAITAPIQEISRKSKLIAEGDTDVELDLTSNIIELSNLTETILSIREMVFANRRKAQQKNRLHRYKEKLNELNYSITEIAQLNDALIKLVVDFTSAIASVFYFKDKQSGSLILQYKYNIADSTLGNGSIIKSDMLEQVKQTKSIVIKTLDQNSIKVTSATVSIYPKFLVLYPVLNNQNVIGVLELLLESDEYIEQEYLVELLDSFSAILINKIHQVETEQLLELTQRHQVRLSETMEELKQQHVALQRSESELEVQADELKIANEQLKKQNEENDLQKMRLAELNEELKISSAELKQASEHKSQFLSRVSHELRTPLNSILILLKTLLRDKESLVDNQLESIQVIYRSSQDLLELINDLLDLARIEAGKISINLTQVKLEHIISRIKEQFSPIAVEKNIEFDVSVDDGLPSEIYTDNQRLLQILRNLISNAIKFTLKGSVSVKVTIQSDWLEFNIKDTGIGIPEEMQKTIFTAFSQIESSEHSSREGTGLGLNICLQLTELLGGKIEVISKADQGSSFSLFIPCTANTNSAQPALGQEADNESSEPIAKETINQVAVYGVKTELVQSKLELKGIDLKLLDLNEVAATEWPLYEDCYLLLGLTEQTHEQFINDELQALIEDSNIKAQIILLQEGTLPKQLTWLTYLAKEHLTWNNAGLDRLIEVIVDPPSTTENSETTLDFIKPEQFSEPHRILLVDDDMSSLFALSKVLTKSGLKTELADNYQLAIEKLNVHNFELIITDLVMPGGNGKKLIAHVKQNKKLKDIPIIVLSASMLEEERNECIELGCSAYLDKPLNPAKILNEIEQLLENHED
jgi:signal transduction histidine kinase/ActR/RegA family two-component response regulator